MHNENKVSISDTLFSLCRRLWAKRFRGRRGIGYCADRGLLRLTPFPSARPRGPCKTLRKKLINQHSYFLLLSLTNKFVGLLSKNKRCRISSTSFCFVVSRKEGDSNPRYPNRVRQFSKLVVSATHPSFLTDSSFKEWCKGIEKKQLCKIITLNFYKFCKNSIIKVALYDSFAYITLRIVAHLHFFCKFAPYNCILWLKRR